ncbi:subtilisin-like protease [Metarhizium robertsii ARSEF 23]|uniref:Subtilisin-like protease n=1 Tax=Metarhizium robertsii (strain ARSEF 23 / ATCC MYA-3075) TaxID=655844 RepID=A0A0B2XA12_METRA|nr:subtilisin-like protease [Metarhizium robertsii ARSEF 23]KHO11658.1 subtilisin-like protease [Metarhizium robertsii ARSEF 23]
MKLSITLASTIVLVAAAPVEVRDPQSGNGLGPGLNQGPSRRPQDSIVNLADRPGLNDENHSRVDVDRPTSGRPQDFNAASLPALIDALENQDVVSGTNLPGLNDELRESVNEKGFTAQMCRDIIANHGKTFAKKFDCE